MLLSLSGFSFRLDLAHERIAKARHHVNPSLAFERTLGHEVIPAGLSRSRLPLRCLLTGFAPAVQVQTHPRLWPTSQQVFVIRREF